MLRLSPCVLVPLLLVACPQDGPILTGADAEAGNDETAAVPTSTTTSGTGEPETTGTDTGEPTTTGTTTEDVTTTGTGGPVAPPICGNGYPEGDELCDDGYDNPDDGCDSKCMRTGVPIWTLSWDSGVKQDDFSAAVEFDADGNIYVAGTVENGDYYSDAVVRKLDRDGAELQQYVYAGQLGLDDVGRAIALGDDGSVFLGGSERVVDDGPGQAFARKFEADGTVAWTFNQAPEFVEGLCVIYDIVVEGDAIFVAGTEEVADKVYEIYIHRLDPDDGQPVWTVNLVDGYGFSSHALAIAPGGDLLLGSALLNAGEDPVPLVARFSPVDGAEVWNKTYGGGRQGSAQALAVDAAGDIAVTGQLMRVDGTWDLWATRLTADGGVTWSVEYDRAEGVDIGLGITWAPGGDIYLGGQVVRKPQGDNAFVARLTGDGEFYWTSEYNDEAGFNDGVVGVAADAERVVVVGVESVIGEGVNQWIRAYEP